MERTIRLPSEGRWLFPEYEFESIEIDQHRGVIIEGILEKGTWEQLR